MVIRGRFRIDVMCATGGLALLAALPSPPALLLLEVSSGGEIAAGEELLYDPSEPDGHATLRSWLSEEVARSRSGERSSDEEPAALEVLVRCEAVSPFEAVQAILAGCGRRGVGIESVRLEVATVRIEPSLVLDSEPGDEDEEARRLLIEVEEAGTFEPADVADGSEERALAYSLGARDCEDFSALVEALAELARTEGQRRIVLDPRRGVACEELRLVLEAVREAGFEDLVIAPLGSAVHRRAVERWDFIADGEWADVYEFLTPERREVESLEQFLAGKEHHDYRDVSDLRVLSVREDRAFVSLTVTWTPLHPELARIDSGKDLAQELEIAETWQWVEGDWYCSETQRLADLLAEHPELEGELEDD